VIAVAPTIGPAQWRVPPSTHISTTVSGIAIVKVSPVVTYEMKSECTPPTMPASPQDSAKAASL